jgi:nicotinamidase-related amidase
MPKNQNLPFGPLGPNAIHLCVDMQNMFHAPQSPWFLPWMPRILPKVTALVAAHPHETVFTRFIPVANVQAAEGAWRRYYAHWPMMTLDEMDPVQLEVLPALREAAPSAEVIDKHVYSPWLETHLQERLAARRVDTLVVTGGETDVCVLATVLGAVDRGYRVVIATDALCSASDEAHDAQLEVYHRRYSRQVETATVADILAHW